MQDIAIGVEHYIFKWWRKGSLGGVCEGVREALFILLGGRFPQTHIWKVIRQSRRYSTSKCTWTGARLGAGDPRGRPPPDGTPPGPPSSGWLTGGS